jgi:hypothetical protein
MMKKIRSTWFDLPMMTQMTMAMMMKMMNTSPSPWQRVTTTVTALQKVQSLVIQHPR